MAEMSFGIGDFLGLSLGAKIKKWVSSGGRPVDIGSIAWQLKKREHEVIRESRRMGLEIETNQHGITFVLEPGMVISQDLRPAIDLGEGFFGSDSDSGAAACSGMSFLAPAEGPEMRYGLGDFLGISLGSKIKGEITVPGRPKSVQSLAAIFKSNRNEIIAEAKRMGLVIEPNSEGVEVVMMPGMDPGDARFSESPAQQMSFIAPAEGPELRYTSGLRDDPEAARRIASRLTLFQMSELRRVANRLNPSTPEAADWLKENLFAQENVVGKLVLTPNGEAVLDQLALMKQGFAETAQQMSFLSEGPELDYGAVETSEAKQIVRNLRALGELPTTSAWRRLQENVEQRFPSWSNMQFEIEDILEKRDLSNAAINLLNQLEGLARRMTRPERNVVISDIRSRRPGFSEETAGMSFLQPAAAPESGGAPEPEDA